MKTDKKTKSGLEVHHLPIQVASLFDDPGEWVIVNFAYWKSNTQTDRRWVLRLEYLQEQTPVRIRSTVTGILQRLHEKGLVEKTPYGVPQTRHCGESKKEAKLVQPYQYVFDAAKFDKILAAFLKSWFVELSGIQQPSVGNPTAPLSEFEQLSVGNRIDLCLETDGTIRITNKNRTKRTKPVIKNQEGNWLKENSAEGKIDSDVSMASGSVGPSAPEKTPNDNSQCGQNTAGNGGDRLQEFNAVFGEPTIHKPGDELEKNPLPSMAPGPEPDKVTNSSTVPEIDWDALKGTIESVKVGEQMAARLLIRKVNES